LFFAFITHDLKGLRYKTDRFRKARVLTRK
jgi:hypothetical protein